MDYFALRSLVKKPSKKSLIEIGVGILLLDLPSTNYLRPTAPLQTRH